MFFSAGARSHFHLKNLPVSDHLVVSCAAVGSVGWRGSFRGLSSLCSHQNLPCSASELPLNQGALSSGARS